MKYLIFLLASFLNWQAFAWDITINPVNDNQMIWLKNTQTINQSNVYLVWFDLDDNKLLSYSVNKGWQKSLEPAFEKVVDLPTFESFPAVNIPAVCPSKHRCFLAFVDVPPNTNVLDVEKWRNAAVLPLSAQAASERLPYQTFFLTEQPNQNYLVGDIFSGGTATTAAPNKTEGTSSIAATEKPDIFRRDGNKVLFANGSVDKFQIIDVSDVNKPRLSAEATLKGTPKEIYAINGFYAVMQSDSDANRLTVFSPELKIVSEQIIKGSFLQSRRRNDVIFSINQNYNLYGSELLLTATSIDTSGNIHTVDSNILQGYSPKVAIFPDYLVIAGYDAFDWQKSIVTIFDLNSPKPLSSPKQIKVLGNIPSEFHLSVQNQQLRVVYGSVFNSKDGSSLAIYDLSKSDIPLIGKVDQIAPNESLFATRFVGDMAYVVTYQRKDPLWAIDLSNPKQPTIKGKLIVPGWSEFMFFNNNKLFAIGFDDQLAEGETWARRVSASLFDVANETDLKLMNKVTPLWGKIPYSYSQATYDERALLLDWDQQLAAFPLESWYGEQGYYLQILRFTDDKLTDAGLLALPLTAQRSLLLDRDKMGILSDQVFFTANISSNDPKLLGELELARNLQWLAKSQNNIIAAASGNAGFYRLYQFDPTNLSKPLKVWSLPHSYSGVRTDGKLAVFFNYNPLTIQAFDLEKNILYPAQATDSKSNGWSSINIVDSGHFYSANQQYLNVQPLEGLNADAASTRNFYHWTLDRWQVSGDKAITEKSLNLAGQPIVIKDNLIISQESEYSNTPHLNLLAFDEERAKLLNTLNLDCRINSYLWAENALYLTCSKDIVVYSYPNVIANDVVPQTSEFSFSLLKVTIQQNKLQISGRWNLTESTRVLSVAQNTVLLGNNYYYYGGIRPMIAIDTMPYYPTNTGCTVYRLETAQLTPLKKLDYCNNADQTVLFEDKLFQTAGFANIQSVSW